jgi:ApaG protein
MYQQTTQDISVSVNPEFLPEQSAPEESYYFWAYTIEIRNKSSHRVRLRSRHWQITDTRGHTEEVRGPGVVGQTPILEPGESFRYTSGCPLRTPSGIMVGSYQMTREDSGAMFSVAIPAFSLDSPFVRAVPN